MDALAVIGQLQVQDQAQIEAIRENLTSIDAEGFCSATNLWKIFGGAPKDKPIEFLRTDSAKAIIGELTKVGNPALKTERGGNNPGTKMHPVLQVEYLRWLDSNFAMHHNQVGHAMVTQPQPLVSLEAKALSELKTEWGLMHSMLADLGYGKGALKAEFLENALKKEAKYNVTLVSDSMRAKLLPGQRAASKTSKTTSVAVVEMGGTSKKVSDLALSHGVTPKEVNDAFVRLGWQYRTKAGWQPKPDGRKYCNCDVRVRGEFTGQEVISGWREALVEKHLAEELKRMHRSA